jgi:hypothetical protein
MLVAKGRDAIVEWDGDTIRLVDTTWIGGIGDVREFSLSSLLDIEWRNTGLGYARIHFVVPGGPPAASALKHAHARDYDMEFGWGQKKKVQELYEGLMEPIRARRAYGHTGMDRLTPGLIAPATVAETEGVTTLHAVRLGEVGRHFDAQTIGSIAGQIDHYLVGSFASGTESISGFSTLRGDLNATTRPTCSTMPSSQCSSEMCRAASPRLLAL